MDIAALVVASISALIALGSVWFARTSSNAATRSADIAEIVEQGRHHGWRIESRSGLGAYTLRNTGTVAARDVSLSGDYFRLGLRGDAPARIEPGQARLIQVLQAYADKAGEIHITWTPDLPDAEPMTWTEPLPVPAFRPPFNDTDWRNITKAIGALADRAR
ncbi:hypothetical protein P5V54_11470 [Mycobacteroides abscessus subsp. abscessus]|uniref:hypothetical protein n=1 Tax=Mycobacteroides abscessus TaxID=36809 RepID=UPI0009A65A29|nr:hypothetical protein [Mycobacteroides abscessus]MDO2994972.1 hypothetical protein [Mycobacteroides abscessus subsp. abscessus]PVA23685.1 hypothetical protein DDJ46_11750 [Mycobacteroides abscessus]